MHGRGGRWPIMGGLSVTAFAVCVAALVAASGIQPDLPEPSAIAVVSPASSVATPLPSATVLPSQPVTSPDVTAPPVVFPPLGAGIVPILYMHRVEAPPADYPTWTVDRRKDFITYDLLPSAFAAQLDWLQAHQYTTILPRDLANHWDHGTRLPPRPVVLTFDDGSHDWAATILPLLQAHHMVAEFYLTLTAIADGSITWAEVEQLAAAGEGIGAHDVQHVQLAELGPSQPPASAAEMWYEVDQARLIIGAHVGVLPDSMAYVGGGFDATLEMLVRRAGYTTARTIIRGIEQDRGHRFELRVVRIGVHDDVTNVMTGALVPGLPIFSERMAGVSDLKK